MIAALVGSNSLITNSDSIAPHSMLVLFWTLQLLGDLKLMKAFGCPH
jgi:hypothetical protein